MSYCYLVCGWTLQTNTSLNQGSQVLKEYLIINYSVPVFLWNGHRQQCGECWGERCLRGLNCNRKNIIKIEFKNICQGCACLFIIAIPVPKLCLADIGRYLADIFGNLINKSIKDSLGH